jgi:hypothetical protein
MPARCANTLVVLGPPGELRRFTLANRGRHADYEEPTGYGIPLSFAAAVPYPRRGRDSRRNRSAAWCIEHWGVEADLGYVQKLRYTSGGGDATYEFPTWRTPPLRWLATVATLYPRLRFALAWDGPAAVGTGTIYYKRGVQTDANDFHDEVHAPLRVPEHALATVAF